jgi:hypothetical protein
MRAADFRAGVPSCFWRKLGAADFNTCVPQGFRWQMIPANLSGRDGPGPRGKIQMKRIVFGSLRMCHPYHLLLENWKS